MRARAHIAAIVVLFVSCLPSYAAAKTYTTKDTTYRATDYSISIFQPAFWVVNEKTFKRQNGSQIVLVTIQDQAEIGSYPTRYAYVVVSDAPGVFGLPQGFTSRLGNSDLVNIYIDLYLRSSLSAKITRQSVENTNGVESYTLESSRIDRGSSMIVYDKFYFKGAKVYQIHAEHTVGNTTAGEKIRKIIGSLTI